MFVVRCPDCKLTMRYAPTKKAPVTCKKKKCVYCGHTFNIHSSHVKSRIVREEQAHETSALFHSESQIKAFKEKLE